MPLKKLDSLFFLFICEWTQNHHGYFRMQQFFFKDASWNNYQWWKDTKTILKRNWEFSVVVLCNITNKMYATLKVSSRAFEKFFFKKNFSEYPLICGFIINELRGASYELQFTIYSTNYELLFIARVPSYFSHTIYELLVVARVTS